MDKKTYPFFPAAGLAAAYFFGGIFAINK